MIAIYRPDGTLLSGSAFGTRRAAREFARSYTGKKWNQLWRRGWRVREIA